MAMTRDQQTHLEDILDGSNLSSLLDALESICYLKAQHLEENWQDNQAAKVWERAGKRLSTLPHAPAIVNAS